MDFTKFVSLISSGNIFFCRSDKFQDPYEGSFPTRNKNIEDFHVDKISLEDKRSLLNKIHTNNIWSRQWTYISCWHVNEFESAAMWKLYAKTEEAIAIETTYEELALCMPDGSLIGLVNYIDYNTEHLPFNNTFYPYISKRKSFEHENEARVIIQNLPVKDGSFDCEKENLMNGLPISVDLNKLIKRIYVAPDAPNWFTEIVTEITEKYSINAPVIKSDLYNNPDLV